MNIKNDRFKNRINLYINVMINKIKIRRNSSSQFKFSLLLFILINAMTQCQSKQTWLMSLVSFYTHGNNKPRRKYTTFYVCVWVLRRTKKSKSGFCVPCTL